MRVSILLSLLAALAACNPQPQVIAASGMRQSFTAEVPISGTMQYEF